MSRLSEAVAVVITQRGGQSLVADEEDLAALVGRYTRTGEIFYVFIRDRGDRAHLVELREDGWVMQHSLGCRADIFNCPLSRAAESSLQDPPAAGPGIYEVTLVNGELVLGDRIGGA